jgi:hypothetical protein
MFIFAAKAIEMYHGGLPEISLALAMERLMRFPYAFIFFIASFPEHFQCDSIELAYVLLQTIKAKVIYDYQS